MFGQMRAARERERERIRLRYKEANARIKHARGNPLMPDDLSGLREEFILNLMGEKEGRAFLLMEHNYAMNSRQHRRSLCCWLFGHKPHAPCEWGAACAAGCSTTCRRCNRTVMPKARLLR